MIEIKARCHRCDAEIEAHVEVSRREAVVFVEPCAPCEIEAQQGAHKAGREEAQAEANG